MPRKKKEIAKSDSMSVALKRAEKSIAIIADREGRSVEAIKNEMKLAMFVALLNDDQKVQAKWRGIPCAGDIPTPEEIIAYCAVKLS